MPLIDAKLLLNTDQAITASAASTDYLDLGAAGKNAFDASQVQDKFTGKPLYLNVVVSEAFATLTSLQIGLEGDSATNFSTALVQYMLSMAIPAASLVAGFKLRMPIPGTFRKRYLRAYYTVAGSNATTGKVTTWIDTD
jgi:hypothetical protein